MLATAKSKQEVDGAGIRPVVPKLDCEWGRSCPSDGRIRRLVDGDTLVASYIAKRIHSPAGDAEWGRRDELDAREGSRKRVKRASERGLSGDVELRPAGFASLFKGFEEEKAIGKLFSDVKYW